MEENFSISSDELQKKIDEYLKKGNVITRLPDFTPSDKDLEKPVGKAKEIRPTKNYDPDVEF